MPLAALVTTVRLCTAARSFRPFARSPVMTPSSCQGVVLADKKGKCQEILSLSTVVRAGSKAWCTSASRIRRPISSITVPGRVFKTATFGLDMFTSLLFLTPVPDNPLRCPAACRCAIGPLITGIPWP